MSDRLIMSNSTVITGHQRVSALLLTGANSGKTVNLYEGLTSGVGDKIVLKAPVGGNHIIMFGTPVDMNGITASFQGTKQTNCPLTIVRS